MKDYILIPLLLVPLAAACTPESMAAPDPSRDASPSAIVKQIEQVLGVQGHVTNNVLKITIPRDDIPQVQGPVGVTFTPFFEIHSELYFQMLGGGRTLLNGYMALREEEVNNFITGLLREHIVFQAFSQVTPMNLQVWYVHFFEIAEPMTMARALRAAMDAAHIPLPPPPPSPSPSNGTKPLDGKLLAHILCGTLEEPQVSDVVTVTVPRTDRVLLGGVRVSPYAGISTEIEFKPTDDKGNAQVCAEFSMTSAEVNPVVKRMVFDFPVPLPWYQGSLHNNEINEQPQLFNDAMVKQGDAYKLAREIRAGLDLTSATRCPRS